MKIHKINRAENSLFSFLIRLTCLFIILLIPCQPKAESMFSEIRRLNIPYAQRFKMHVEGTNAYLGSYNWGELLIIDISNTGAPSIISNTRINQNASFIIHDIWYSNNYVYFAHRNGDVTKVDVSNRQTPIVSFRCMQTSYTHNGLITSYSRGLQKEILYVADHYAYYPAFRVYDPKTNICIGTSPLYDDGREIEITSSGDVLYQAIWGSAPRINVYLVVDPANPSLIRTLDVFAHEMVISPDNKYLYLVYDKPADNIIEGVMIVDISTPTNPVPVATIPLPGARELTLDYSNKRIFVKTRSDLAANPIPLGIYAFDIRNIASIKQLGFHPTSGDNEDFDIWYDNQRLYYVDNNSLGSQFVVLNVNKTNNPPIASNFQITLDEDGTKSFSLNASDPDGDVTTYKILDLPDFGSLSGNPPNYTYTPLKNFHGNDSFIFEISDGVFQASATASITVNPVNDPPFIDEIPAKTIAEMSQLSFHVSASDVDNDPITLSATQLPEGASFVNGNFLWTPDYKQAGVYNVCFIANDPHTSYTRNLTITVTNVNRPPVANAQSVTADEDIDKAITLSGSDPDGETLSYSVKSNPTKGTLSGTPPNLTYTPNPNFNGNDEFRFTVSDGELVAEAVVSIKVNAINDKPVLNAIADQSISEASLLTFTVTGSDVDGDPLTFSAVNLPSGATFNNKTFNWTPGYDQAGSYKITVSVSDGKETVSQVVNITVSNKNRAPVANAGSITTDEDKAVSIVLSGSDPDGENLTYQVTVNPKNGTLSGTAPNLTYTPKANYNGNDELKFTVSDGELVSEAIVSVTINAVNDKPVLNTIANQSIIEASLLTFTVTGSDVDDDPLTFSAVNLPSGATFNNKTFNWTPGYDQAGSYKITVSVSDGKETVSQVVNITVSNKNRAPVANAGSITTDEDKAVSIVLSGSDPDGENLTYQVTVNPKNGTLSGTAPNLTYTPDANYNGNDEFTFSVSDGELVAEAVVLITVDAVNDKPVLNAIADQSITETSLLTFTAAGSDVDGDPLTFSATDLPAGATFNNATFNWTPGYDQSGSYKSTVSVSDGKETVSQVVNITVSNKNRAPVANAGSITTDEDKAVSIVLSGSDPDGENLTYQVTVNPKNGTLSGTAPNLTYTPKANYNGNDELKFTVSDGELVAEAVVSITVDAVNDKPVLNAIADQSITETSLLTFTAAGSDVDGDPLTFSATDLPAGATFNDATFNWTPGYDQAGSYKITVSVSDGKETVSQVVNITVSNKNRAPVANAGSITTDEDKAVSIVLSGSDPDGENLTYQVTVNPKNGTLSGTAPNLTYTPDANYNGNDELTFTVSDGELVAEAVVSITVDAVNDAPVLHSISPKIISENSLLTFVATGSDVDNDSLIFSAANLPVGAEFNKGMFTWIPAFNQSGSYTIKVSVTDGILTSYQNVTITVQNTPVKAKVYMYDEAMNNPVSSNPRLYLVNVSNETINGGRIEYYFSADNGETPQLDKYYTANVKVTLAHCGDDDYVIIYDLTGIKLAPGAVFPNTGGMVVGISYKNWSVVNKTNDYSNNLAMSYKENEKICIYDDDNRLLGGLKPEKTDILPFADAGRDIWSINTRVNLDASGSYDLLGEIVQHEWIIDGNVVSTDISPMLSFNYGVTTVTLRVTNNEGLSSTDEVNVYVQRDNEVLVAIKEDPVPENTPVNVEYYVPLKLAGCAINLIINNAWGGTNSVTLNGSAGYHDEKIWSWTSNSQGGVGPWTIKVKVNGQITQTMSIKFTK